MPCVSNELCACGFGISIGSVAKFAVVCAPGQFNNYGMSLRSEKLITLCAPCRLSEVFPMLPLKQLNSCAPNMKRSRCSITSISLSPIFSSLQVPWTSSSAGMARDPHYPCMTHLMTRGTFYDVGYNVGLNFSERIKRYFHESDIHLELLPFYDSQAGRDYYEESLLGLPGLLPSVRARGARNGRRGGAFVWTRLHG